jgi:hypothetical protein
MEFGRNNFRQLYVITHTLPFLHCLDSGGKQFPPLSCTLSPSTHRKQCIKSKRFFHSSVEATGIDKNNTIRVSEGRSWWFSDNSIKIARCLLHFPPFVSFVFSFLLWYQFVDISGSRSCIIKTSIFSTRGHATRNIGSVFLFHYQTRKSWEWNPPLENKLLFDAFPITRRGEFLFGEFRCALCNCFHCASALHLNKSLKQQWMFVENRFEACGTWKLMFGERDLMGKLGLLQGKCWDCLEGSCREERQVEGRLLSSLE